MISAMKNEFTGSQLKIRNIACASNIDNIIYNKEIRIMIMSAARREVLNDRTG